MAQLFNQKAVAAKRNRAAAIARSGRAKGADFLLKLATEDICDRLAATNREFNTIIELFPLNAPSPLEKALAPGARNYDRISRFDALQAKEENSTDLVVCALSLHWQENIPLLLQEINRILKPDGLFLAAVPGEDTLSELRDVLLRAETEISGGAAPRIDPFPTVSSLGGLLQNTGFALPVIDLERFTARYDNMLCLIADLRAMGATSSLLANGKTPNRAVFAHAASLYQQDFAEDDGRITAGFTITHLSGWKPHDSQQKPLKPGSATASLRDFL